MVQENYDRALVVSAAATVGTWDVYDKGFWGAQGLLTIESYDELEAMRTQPSDVHPHDFNEFTDAQSYGDYTFTEAHIIPAAAFMQWEIYQPGNYMMMDFADANNHQNAEQEQNAASVSTTFLGSEKVFSKEGQMTLQMINQFYLKVTTTLYQKFLLISYALQS